jgi:hypothetical protein
LAGAICSPVSYIFHVQCSGYGFSKIALASSHHHFCQPALLYVKSYISAAERSKRDKNVAIVSVSPEKALLCHWYQPDRQMFTVGVCYATARKSTIDIIHGKGI